MSNIKDWEKFAESQWDWTIFNDCFLVELSKDIGIRISDIDGHVERKGHWLRIEGTEKLEMSGGQLKSIRRDVDRGTTVLIIIGPANEPNEMRIYRPFDKEPKVFRIRGITRIQQFITGWFRWADANGYIGPDVIS